MKARPTAPWSKTRSVVQTAIDHKALDIIILEVTQHCGYADYFVLMSASSQRHARALADAVMEEALLKPAGVEGYAKGEWILLDLCDVVVHIFQEPRRVYYNFDKLWGHVPRKQAHSFLKLSGRRTRTNQPPA